MDEGNSPFIASQNGQNVVRNEFFKEALQLPRAIPENIRPILSSVILLARDSDEAGADTVTSLLRMALESACSDVVIIDFKNDGEEGPGCSIPISSRSQIVKCDLKQDLAPQIGTFIAKFIYMPIIINAPSDMLNDFWLIEPDIRGIMEVYKKPYHVFWIDGEMDERSNVLLDYAVDGDASIVVLAREPITPEQAKRGINVKLPKGVTSFVTIPRICGQMERDYYQKDQCLELAYNDAFLGEKLVFSRKYVDFLTGLTEALKCCG